MKVRALQFAIFSLIFEALSPTQTVAQAVPLAITTTSLPAATVGVTYNTSTKLTATGGALPYVAWGISSGSLPSGLNLNSTTGAISGTPAANAATSTIVFEVTDSANATAKSASLTITVIVPLNITTTTLPSGVNGVAYPTTTLAAAGGTPPYTWTQTANPSTLPTGVTAGLPPGLTLSATGVIAGTPATIGTFQFGAAVKDSASTPATVNGTFTITITSANPGPALIITTVGSTAPNQQPQINIGLASANALTLTGTLTAAFVARAGTGVTDDPNIQFVQANSTTGSRQVAFTIPAGQTQATFANGTTKLATGTVAGVITLAVTTLTDSTGAAVPLPTALTITTPPSAPTITNVTITSGLEQFTIHVTGFSPTRDATTITFHFVPSTGTTLTQADVTVDASSAFRSYFTTAAAQAAGSAFVASVPFTYSVSGFPFVAVTVNVANSVGTSVTAGPYNP